MKKIFAAMLIVFMAVGSAYAVDISVTGKDKIRGTYQDNLDSVNSDSNRGAYMYYDHELVLDPIINISDATNITMRLELNDATWTDSNRGHSSGEVDDNIRVEYLYGNHTFSTGTQFQGGQMPTGQWGYTFGDTETPGWRARINQPVGGGTLIFILHKAVEAQAEADMAASAPVEGENSESKDLDAYLLGWTGKAGNITISPLLYYIQNGTPNTDVDSSDTDNTLALDLAADGQAGMVGWEAEFIYKSTTKDGTNAVTDPDVDDANVYGLYAGVNFNLGTITPGLKIAYGSFDKKDGSFDYGEDYDAGGMMIFGEDVGFGPGMGKTDGNVAGATTVTAYADFNVNDAMSLHAGLAYLMSNSDESGDPWKDASAYEMNVKGAYKFTENVSYHVDCGYAAIDWDSDPDTAETDDPDGITKIQHYLTIEF